MAIPVMKYNEQAQLQCDWHVKIDKIDWIYTSKANKDGVLWNRISKI